MPSTAADAAGLLASGDRRPEPGRLRREQDALLPARAGSDAARRCRSAAPRIVRPGRDVTVVALSRLVHEALAAADELAAEGIEVEVVDPRTLVPLDLDTIVELGRAHPPARRRPRGGRARRLRRRDRRAGAGGGVRRARRADRARRRPVHADPVQPAARGRVPARPRGRGRGGALLVGPLADGLLEHGQHGLVLGLVGDLGDDLRVDDGPVGVEHEDRHARGAASR